MTLEDELVARVHTCLAEALHRTRKAPFDAPVTVAEIYQDLVPYRRIRGVVGFQMNADYEHTLLRLLSGEGGYARLEPTEAREELRIELDLPNPNVGLFRKFAACDVWVTPADAPPPEEAEASVTVTEANGASPAAHAAHGTAAAPEPVQEAQKADATENASGAEDTDADTEAPSWEEEVREWTGTDPGLEPELLLEEEVEPADPQIEIDPVHTGTPPAPGAPDMLDTRTQAPASAAVPGGSCAFCDSTLPGGRLVRFCPHCGTDQSLRPCAGCAEPLDRGWKFCIACGATQD